MRFDLDGLQPHSEPGNGHGASGEGAPLQLAIDTIDDDPAQPRQEFDAEPLRELAESIAEHGVLQAISVRRHPDQEDRWIVNLGARRLRASRLLGLTTIAAYVNDTPGCYDQVIENEQREALRPLELALFIQRRLALGESQTDIARRMGKSRAYVTFAMALIDAPDWLMAVYREGRCRGMHQLYDLRRLHDANPQLIEERLSGTDIITRADVQTLQQRLGDGESTSSAATNVAAVSVAAAPTADDTQAPLSVVDAPLAFPTEVTRTSSVDETTIGASSSDKSNRAHGGRTSNRLITLWGTYEGADVMIDLREAPAEDGHLFVLRAGESRHLAVQASLVQLRRAVAASS